ncbi:MAG: YsnF/AvaK domain-containing protein [Chloroflexota bacterium]
MAKNFSSQVTDGMEVVDANEEKVGTVHEVYDAPAAEKSSSGGGYLRVPTGFLGMGKEHHIPFSAIRDVRQDHIYLSVMKDRLDELGYDAAPMAADETHVGQTVERTISTTTSTPPAPNPRQETEQAPRKLQLREEELIARKRSVQTGQVDIHTQVVSEQRTIEVPVMREEVTIERRAVEPRPSDRPIEEHGRTISIPVREEQVIAEKRAVVYEELEVGKRTVQETRHVSETLRREEAVIDKEGSVELEGETKKPGHSQPG